MPDLRTVLTETLAQQLRCSGVLPPSDETYRTYETKIQHLAQDFADAILGRPGVADIGELLEEVERLRSRESRIRELCESRLKNSASKVIAAIHVSRILAVLDNWAPAAALSVEGNTR